MNPTQARLGEIRERMAAACALSGRPAEAVRLIAVAKTATPDTLQEAWLAGQTLFAHNRIDRLEEHHRVLPQAEWHVIGPLQSKKMRRAVALASCIQTVGDEQTVARLVRRVADLDTEPRPILLQVNLTPEDNRYGVEANLADALLQTCLATETLSPQGLMTMAPHGADAGVLHRHFACLRELGERLVLSGLPQSHELSMGMSDDFEIAIAEGATLVRIGRAIFPLLTS
ncbi:MAG: YggS family pyridoxal phosphate-dependent enzyme [Planctomycetes bacterium]|jgi:hypothetical protein|nr:YggS family pyridoxal phosphate-dependent enzyme [Planctomycetota bacterium]MBT4029685.1 YggS family pyridoxal phosphate-dependent enzyme [Planctomycetota bacterium]MBT4561185.1 YggS family pyridoxal phosphate-dependent enzyme [Planctomycetota bacterium]MBT5101407.1 YggS family pyridoxal phosphate-dependent enzyme [Planctomycetota bacterium]MBT7012091.1 YggS family pyridoxal phosphate-dependent enzyme [Planctomycetota bacterium]